MKQDLFAFGTIYFRNVRYDMLACNTHSFGAYMHLIYQKRTRDNTGSCGNTPSVPRYGVLIMLLIGVT